jgi:N-acetylglucosamine-6-phosphate deacetylase
MSPDAGPGWVDLQVNGYAGVDFASPALGVEQVLRAARGLREHGTRAFCPTLVSAAPETYRRVLPVLAEAMESAEGGELLGIHLEGPFISPVDGARGAHPLAHVRAPSLQVFDQLYRLANGKICLLTLAPELPGALELIRHAVGLGVRVGLGHTLAGSREIWAAAEAGASLATHLGNGLPLHIPRHDNPLWPLLACPALSAMLITDGHHLPADFVRVALAVKGAGGLIVTSDSSPAAGLPPGDYEFFGTPARLEVDGRLHSPLTGTLAGSSLTLGECLAWLEKQRLLDPPALLLAGRDNPLAALGL